MLCKGVIYLLAILSGTIEDAGRLSVGLQGYWNAQGVYASVSLFETEQDFLAALERRPYEHVILESVGNPLALIPRIRGHCPDCKIAVVTNSRDPAKDSEIAAACHSLGVEIMLTRADLEQPLALLSKRLCLL